MCSVFGCFILRNEGNGCLTSVYHEHREVRPYTESCIITSDGTPDDPFVGIFSTVWLEPENRIANLTITRDNLIYNLVWNNISRSNNSEYMGSAFLSEGRLIGTYWLVNR